MKAAVALAAPFAILLLSVLACHGQPMQEALAHDAASPGAHAVAGAGSAPVIAALRANGARVTDLGERGGLSGHFVELADGDAYGLYMTPDGHAVAGLLYGPDGFLLTGRQIAAARGEPDAADETFTGDRGRRGSRGSGVSAASGMNVPEESAVGGGGFAHAYAAGPNPSDARVPDQFDTVDRGDGLHQGVALARGDALFRVAASAFGFTLGRTGPLVVAIADPGCRWSRSAVARLAQPALAGRLRLRVVPVGVLGAASAREAAAIASAANPALAWFEGAATRVKPEGARRIERNNTLLDAWGAGAVPLIAWQGSDGRVAYRVGDIDDLQAWLEDLRHE